jgi:uncharacterized protein RhaS with RHS repeats
MRDYDPTTGRYLQADPLGLVDGASVYGYARQNPGRWVDVDGRVTTEHLLGPTSAQAKQNSVIASSVSTSLISTSDSGNELCFAEDCALIQEFVHPDGGAICIYECYLGGEEVHYTSPGVSCPKIIPRDFNSVAYQN